AFPGLAPDPPALLRLKRPREWARLAQLQRELASIHEERRNRGDIPREHLRPLFSIKRWLGATGQPSLNAVSRHLQDLRLAPKALGDNAVILDAPFLGQPV